MKPGSDAVTANDATKASSTTTTTGGDDTSVSFETPTEMSKEDYRNLIQQIQSDFSKDECYQELLDAARYDDIDVARALLFCHKDLHGYYIHLPSSKGGTDGDGGGVNTPLHMAAANGHVSIVQLLLAAGADSNVVNAAGNTPLHWAATNGKDKVVEVLLKQKDIDVLKRNQFGRSVLTEGFTSENQTVIQSLLEHDSATEERLMDTTGSGGKVTTTDDDDEDADDADETSAAAKDSVTHDFVFGSFQVRARERAIAKSEQDSILGQDRPEDDRTGLGIWAASLVAAQWMARILPTTITTTQSASSASPTILELGAGCGLPSLVAALAVPGGTVYGTDFNPETVANLQHNINLNHINNDGDEKNSNLSQTLQSTNDKLTTKPSKAKALLMNWQDPTTYPNEKIDILIGSDLIYQSDMVPLLVQTIHRLLNPNSTTSRFYYVAPESGRQGQDEFFQQLVGVVTMKTNNEKKEEESCCLELVQISEQSAPKEYTSNPLQSQDDEDCFLHFTELNSTVFRLYEFRWKQQQQ